MHPDEYHKLAQAEDHMWYFHALHGRVDAVLSRAFSDRAVHVLDAGCGTGGLIRRLAARHPAWRCTGIDADPTPIALAQGRTASPEAGARIQFATARVETLPFEDRRFDAVISADVLCNVEDDGAGLREMRRVLRPGGLLVVNVPAYQWLWSYHDDAVYSRRRYGRSELRRKLLTAGFRAPRVTYRQTLLFPLIAARRKLLPPPASGSDVGLGSPLTEAVLRGVTGLEGVLLDTFGFLPFGSSVFAVAWRD